MIIDENQLSPAHNILSITKLKKQTTKTSLPQQQTKTAIVESYLRICDFFFLPCSIISLTFFVLLCLMIMLSIWNAIVSWYPFTSLFHTHTSHWFTIIQRFFFVVTLVFCRKILLHSVLWEQPFRVMNITPSSPYMFNLSLPQMCINIHQS